MTTIKNKGLGSGEGSTDRNLQPLVGLGIAPDRTASLFVAHCLALHNTRRRNADRKGQGEARCLNWHPTALTNLLLVLPKLQ